MPGGIIRLCRPRLASWLAAVKHLAQSRTTCVPHVAFPLAGHEGQLDDDGHDESGRLDASHIDRGGPTHGGGYGGPPHGGGYGTRDGALRWRRTAVTITTTIPTPNNATPSPAAMNG